MWMTLSVHLEHLFEIGKVTDHLNGLVNASLEQKYYQIVEEISIRSKQIKNPIRTPFKEIFNELAKDEGKIKFNMLNIVNIIINLLPPRLRLQLVRDFYIFNIFLENV